MFSIKIFHFLKGYVILSIKGHNKEEFLNEILKAGVKPADIVCHEDKIRLKLTVSDFFKMKNSGAKGRIHIEEKHGTVFLLNKLKKRTACLVGLTAFIMFFAIGSQFIWSIEYDCGSELDKQKLEQAVRLAGLTVGMPKAMLKPGIEMKNIILNNTDNISWCWVYIKGTKAVVKVRENIPAPEIFDTEAPCDIIAMRSGIIKRVVTQRGHCIAEENRAVAPGDVIISGTFEFENEPGYQVHSKGTVEAYTEHTKTGTYKQYYCCKEYTGRKRNFLTLKIYKWEVPLYIKRDIKYEMYDTEEKNHDLQIGKDNYIGIGFRTTGIKEYRMHKEPISYDAAVQLAVNELEREISKELLPPAVMTDKRADVSKVDEETITVTVTMNFVEQIGTEKQIEEVTFIEPKTDKLAAGD